MSFFLLKIIISALIISFVSWYSGKDSGIAVFLTALPLVSLLALAFSHIEFKEPAQSVAYAKSIFTAVPLSLGFFVPFLFAERFQLNFWTCYFMGLLIILIGFLVHQYVLKF